MIPYLNLRQEWIADIRDPICEWVRPDDYWIVLGNKLPWETVEECYLSSMGDSGMGRNGYSARFAFGAILAQTVLDVSDRRFVAIAGRTPSIQAFLGLEVFDPYFQFDASSLVHFRKRFSDEYVNKINEDFCQDCLEDGLYVLEDSYMPVRVIPDVEKADTMEHASTVPDDENHKTEQHKKNGFHRPQKRAAKAAKKKAKQKDARKNRQAKEEAARKAAAAEAAQEAQEEEQNAETFQNSGVLIIDATVAPSNIAFPTDIDLLNSGREYLETGIRLLWPHCEHNGHMLPYSAKKARQSYLNVSKAKRWTQAKVRSGIGDQIHYIELAIRRFNELALQAPSYAFRKFSSQLLDCLLVVPQVLAQQKFMYENNTHKCPDRIVSYQQPFVRPIYRGKHPQATEFGQKLHLSVVNGYTFVEKTSWSNFNEGNELQNVVENYRKRFGFYPKAVLADQIYRTRANRAFCKDHGIRLSGPPLGRRKADDSDQEAKKQAYQDSCERNTIEGKNGVAKRRYGLDCIMCKLSETAKTQASLSILAMNTCYWYAQEQKKASRQELIA